MAHQTIVRRHLHWANGPETEHPLLLKDQKGWYITRHFDLEELQTHLEQKRSEEVTNSILFVFLLELVRIDLDFRSR